MLRSLAILVSVLFATAAGLAAQQRIVPLGDSITESFGGRAGYRYFLWKRLDQAKHCVDFIGCRTGVASGVPLFDDFDQDHSGFSGYPAVWLDELMRIDPAVVPCADIALVHLGTNDILWPLLNDLRPDLPLAMRSLQRIVLKLRGRNPAVKIAIAKILPIDSLGSPTPTAREYVPIWNEHYLPLVAAMSTATSPIVLVDMNSDVKPAVHFVDEVHPNDDGAALIADRWFGALRNNGWLQPPQRCVATLSPGCSSGPDVAVPQLTVGTPVLGSTMAAVVKGLPDQTDVVALVIGGQENTPPIGWRGCPIHPSLDIVLLRWFPARPFPSLVQFDLVVPSATPPGLEIYLQAAISTLAPHAGSGGTSNGLQMILY